MPKLQTGSMVFQSVSIIGLRVYIRKSYWTFLEVHLLFSSIFTMTLNLAKVIRLNVRVDLSYFYIPTKYLCISLNIDRSRQINMNFMEFWPFDLEMNLK